MPIIPKPNQTEQTGNPIPKYSSIVLMLHSFEHMSTLLHGLFQNLSQLKVDDYPSASQYLLEVSKQVDYPEEAYELTLKGNLITITASSDSGVYYAVQSFVQLYETELQLYEMTIYDSPKMKHRGFMLDTSRHFIPVDEIKSVIDSASRLKMNRFHWHLTDDHGWRLEIKKFPQLTEKTEHFYRQSEVISIVEYARKRMINVIPEIDMPGHVLGLLTVMPTLSCQPQEYKLASGPSISEDVLCLGNEKTYDIMKQILDEVISLFDSPDIHIGGDEVPKTRWLSCEKCRSKAEALQLEKPSQLQTYFLQEMINHLNQHGRRVILWNDSCTGDQLQGDVVCQYWMAMDKEVSIEKMKQNYPIIDSNFGFYYLDYPIEMRSLEGCYHYRSIFEGTSNHGLLGIECALWTEWVPDNETLMGRIYPRLMAVAESAWTHESLKSYPDFELRLNQQLKWWQASGIKVVDRERWNLKGVNKIFHTYRHIKRMLSLKTLKTAIKMQKQNKMTF